MESQLVYCILFFEYASKENIKYVIVLGENELKNKKFKIKDILNRTEYEIDIDEISKIKKKVNFCLLEQK